MIVIVALVLCCWDGKVLAEEVRPPDHLLDGTSMDYYYQTAMAIHLELYNGK